jgi:hypothetical protein
MIHPAAIVLSDVSKGMLISCMPVFGYEGYQISPLMPFTNLLCGFRIDLLLSDKNLCLRWHHLRPRKNAYLPSKQGGFISHVCNIAARPRPERQNSRTSARAKAHRDLSDSLRVL